MENRVISLGFFDGVHLGHGALLKKTAERAKAAGAVPAVLSFDTHPGDFISKKRIPLINSPAERKALIKKYYGIDEVIFLHFDEMFMKMDWKEFLNDLKSAFCPIHLVAGHDYHFGYHGKGSPDKLQMFCHEAGLGCDIIQKVELEGTIVSSTHIRSLLIGGEMDAACRHLGHPHLLIDIVRSGYKLGRTMGVPTINMRFSEGVLAPKHGVYGTMVTLPDLVRKPAVTNVGVRPTVSGGQELSVESYILDYTGNLYGQTVQVEFYTFLRPEMKFDGISALKDQIQRDAQKTREYFSNV